LPAFSTVEGLSGSGMIDPKVFGAPLNSKLVT